MIKPACLCGRDQDLKRRALSGEWELLSLEDWNCFTCKREVEQAYLQSERWAKKRRAIRVRDRCCRTCGSTDDPNTHHIVYKRYGHEDLEDLTLLCESCHAEHSLGVQVLKPDTVFWSWRAVERLLVAKCLQDPDRRQVFPWEISSANFEDPVSARVWQAFEAERNLGHRPGQYTRELARHLRSGSVLGACERLVETNVGRFLRRGSQPHRVFWLGIIVSLCARERALSLGERPYGPGRYSVPLMAHFELGVQVEELRNVLAALGKKWLRQFGEDLSQLV